MLQPGLCGQVINRALKGELSGIPEARKAVAPMDLAEASRILADVVHRTLGNVLEYGSTREAAP